MQTASFSTELLFIEDGVGRRRRSKQARAHVAKVNRQKQKDKNLKTAKKSLGGEAKESTTTASRNPAPEPCDTGHVSQDADSVTKVVDEGLEEHRHVMYPRRCYSEPAVPRLNSTILPVLGGLGIGSRNIEQYPEAIEVAKYCFNHIMSSWLAPELTPAWIFSYFHDPVTFHSLSYSCGIIQDVSNGRPIRQQRLVHRHRTIQLVNEQLDKLDVVDPEPIILAVMTLWRINYEQLERRDVIPLLFVPHQRSATWVMVFGKLGSEDVHSQALLQLVRRIGGLRNFKTLPGLQESVALADVLDSSLKAKKPSFPTVWTTHMYIESLDHILKLLWDDVEGQGFETSVPGGLPNPLLTTLKRLSALDKLLDYFNARSITLDEEYALTILGYGVQHDLLSMPPWHRSAAKERAGSYHATHELCRLTAIIYSNSVIFPMCPGEKWLELLLKQLREVIETSNIVTWDQRFKQLALWAMIVAGIASLGTSHKTFFVDGLQHLLTTLEITTWSQVNSVVKHFLWRNSSCGKGAAVLWDLVHLQEISD